MKAEPQRRQNSAANRSSTGVLSLSSSSQSPLGGVSSVSPQPTTMPVPTGPVMTAWHSIEISESRVGVACPLCPEALAPPDVRAILDDWALLERLEEYQLRRFLAADPDTRWCPAPDCSYAVIAYGCAECPKLCCGREGCDTEFCYHCRQLWHPNQTSDQARRQRTRHTSGGGNDASTLYVLNEKSGGGSLDHEEVHGRCMKNTISGSKHYLTVASGVTMSAFVSPVIAAVTGRNIEVRVVIEAHPRGACQSSLSSVLSSRSLSAESLDRNHSIGLAHSQDHLGHSHSREHLCASEHEEEEERGSRDHLPV